MKKLILALAMLAIVGCAHSHGNANHDELLSQSYRDGFEGGVKFVLHERYPDTAKESRPASMEYDYISGFVTGQYKMFLVLDMPIDAEAVLHCSPILGLVYDDEQQRFVCKRVKP